jgi:integrase
MARKRRRGFGQLRQLPSGRWQAQYVGPDGQLHREEKGKSYAEEWQAEAWLAAERKKIDLGTWGAVERSDGITLKAYADQWLEERRVKGELLRPRTKALYASLLRRLVYPALGDVKLVSITPPMVRSWHSGLGKDHPTQSAHAYSLLHAIMQTAFEDEVIDANPCRVRGAMATERKREVHLLTEADLNKLAKAMPSYLRASVILAAWCGLRWGETSELRRKDVSADGKVLKIQRGVTYRDKAFHYDEPKTKASIRTVDVPPHIAPMVVAHLKTHVGKDREALLFPAEDGGNLRADQYRPHWDKARAAIGQPTLRVHDLRHLGAVIVAKYGNTVEVMARIGHTTPSQAMEYQHMQSGRGAELAAMMSADAKEAPPSVV